MTLKHSEHLQINAEGKLRLENDTKFREEK
jgi:hypothetical protein